jgi:predicted short-subunit dehydrogenase-like oxidoreductase (DUF2520 family)
VDVVLLAVPDDALTDVASQIARVGGVGSNQVVLHLSGVQNSSVLRPLEVCGCAVGSLHPLQSLSDAATAPDRLRGAAAAVEGDSEAVAMAEELALALGMKPLRVTAAAKPLYHAAAVFASNYIVVVAAAAQALLQRAGVAENAAREALVPMIRGTVENIVQAGAAAALTGPVVRGDSTTVRKHLDGLPPEEAALYRALGRAALNLAQLEEADRAAVERELDA